ncbi:type IIA topoisomerase [Zymobacter palmae]|uniref:Type IIA topoisomerase n=1 Tax=Zymobacter palmae TaxID=33074 RepID=A0A348HCF0_9GAMM|nr:type IIA topoisomerase [Zymobacter palmae]
MPATGKRESGVRALTLEAVNGATVFLVWPMLRRLKRLACQRALFGPLLTLLTAFRRLLIKQLGFRRTATLFTQRHHFDLDRVPALRQRQAHSHSDLLADFDALTVTVHLATFDGLLRHGARLEETGGPKPFVQAHLHMLWRHCHSLRLFA